MKVCEYWRSRSFLYHLFSRFCMFCALVGQDIRWAFTGPRSSVCRGLSTINFFVPMIGRIMKTCKVIVLNIIYKHAPWPSILDLHFLLSSTLSEFYIDLNTKVCCSIPMMARIMKPCIVIVLDILYKHAPWTGTLDLHLMVHQYSTSMHHEQVPWTYISWSINTLQACTMNRYPGPTSHGPSILYKHAPWTGTMDLHLMVLDILYKHAPWSGSLDIQLMVHQYSTSMHHEQVPWTYISWSINTQQACAMNRYPGPTSHGPSLTYSTSTHHEQVPWTYISWSINTLQACAMNRYPGPTSHGPWHTLQTCTMIRYPGPTSHGPSILYKHAPWTGTLNLSVVPIVASYRKLVTVAKNWRESIETFHYRLSDLRYVSKFFRNIWFICGWLGSSKRSNSMLHLFSTYFKFNSNKIEEKNALNLAKPHDFSRDGRSHFVVDSLGI